MTSQNIRNDKPVHTHWNPNSAENSHSTAKFSLNLKSSAGREKDAQDIGVHSASIDCVDFGDPTRDSRLKHLPGGALIMALCLQTATLHANEELLSINSAGEAANNYSSVSMLSKNGRYVVFQSEASNLVAGDNNESTDIFRHDRQTGSTVLVSRSENGDAVFAESTKASISDDGRFVAFQSSGDALSSSDVNGTSDIFVRDLENDSLQLISATLDGSSGNGTSGHAVISGNGQFVAFSSDANDLGLNDNNNTTDVFLRDLNTATTTVISLNTNGSTANAYSAYPAISNDGDYIAFVSNASDLVPNDHNESPDVFLYHRPSGNIQLVSVNSEGVQGNLASGSFGGLDVSDDGSKVVFHSHATNLVNNDKNSAFDIYLRDLNKGSTTLVSRNNAGVQGDDYSSDPSLSADGRYVVFHSAASNLQTGITNWKPRIYSFDSTLGIISKVSANKAGYDIEPTISADGKFISYTSTGSSNSIYLTENNHAPTLEFPVQVTLTEGKSNVGLIAAHDVDGEALSYHISGGADQTRFSLNTTGQLSFISAPAFNTPLDSNSDNRYEVQVNVKDTRGGQSSQAITVIITAGTADTISVLGDSKSKSSGGGITGILSLFALLTLAALRRRA